MPIGLDPQSTCSPVYEGVTLTCRYMTLGQRIRLNRAIDAVRAADSDEAALTALTAAARDAGLVAVGGKPLTDDVLGDTFTLREAFVLLRDLPSLVSDIEFDLKKASPSQSPSAPDTSAPTASVPV